MDLNQWRMAFVLTICVELIGWLGLFFTLYQKQENLHSFTKGCLLVMMATCLTHPLLWFCITPLCLILDLPLYAYLFMGEVYVWFVEGIVYMLSYRLKPLENPSNACFIKGFL